VPVKPSTVPTKLFGSIGLLVSSLLKQIVVLVRDDELFHANVGVYEAPSVPVGAYQYRAVADPLAML
jgi:hypothetical protein